MDERPFSVDLFIPQYLGGYKQIAVSVREGTVTLEINCGDKYEARIFYEDLIERFKRGEGVSVSFRKEAPYCSIGF